MDTLAGAVEELLTELGFELVTLERGGGRRRPLLRLRVDRPGSRPGHSDITVEDCAELSRTVRELLERRATGEEGWGLEVSSPGVERPLSRPRDYERFAGESVRLRTFQPLPSGSRQVEGRLLGLHRGDREEDEVVLEVSGERVVIALPNIARATLAYDLAASFEGQGDRDVK